jgi:hypothetical protein
VTSQEISGCELGPGVPYNDVSAEPVYFSYLDDIAAFVKEIAYQLAVMNERNAESLKYPDRYDTSGIDRLNQSLGSPVNTDSETEVRGSDREQAMEAAWEIVRDVKRIPTNEKRQAEIVATGLQHYAVQFALRHQRSDTQK